MEHSTVVADLIALLNKSLDIPHRLDASSEFIADLGMESIQVIEYLCEVEDRFDLAIDEVTLADVRTVAELADVVIRLSKE